MKLNKNSILAVVAIGVLASTINLLPVAVQAIPATPNTTEAKKDDKKDDKAASQKDTDSKTSTGKSCGGTSTALIDCDDSENGLVSLIKMVVGILYTVIGILAVVMVMAAGVVYATAGENANQVSLAKTMIRNTVIGILLYVFMTVILNFLVPGGVF